MGCCGSSSGCASEPEPDNTNTHCVEAEAVSDSLNKKAHDRLRKLAELDASTKIPFLLVELTGEGDGKGEIEVVGKDEYGVHAALDSFFLAEDGWWQCIKEDPGDESEDTQIPFCKLRYSWPTYMQVGEEGENNMGRAVMKLIDFMAGTLSWTLAVVNSGNVGKTGEVHEMQIIFKSPHPMNFVVPHLMIELRSAGYVEICADLEEAKEEDKKVMETIHQFLSTDFKAEPESGHEDFCDYFYKVGDGVFQGQCGGQECNFGLLTTKMCDKVVLIPGWSLVASSCGSVGENGEQSEQQLVFRRDYNPLGDSPYILVVLNEKNDIEVNGQARGPADKVLRKLDNWLKNKWKCEPIGKPIWDGSHRCMRYKWQSLDFMECNVQLMSFFEMQGYETQVCTQYQIMEDGQMCKEQQLFFRPGKTDVGTIEPHLLIELYAGEGNEDLYAQSEPEVTQVLGGQYMSVAAVQEQNGSEEVKLAMEEIEKFVGTYLSGAKDSATENKFLLDIFMCRGWYENNVAQWTMRVCDFMCDRLGWSFIICSLCNSGERGHLRRQQLIFRWEGEKRDVPVSAVDLVSLDPGMWADTPVPDYWCSPKVEGGEIFDVVSGSDEERSMLQVMLDSTFKRVLTRDRQPDDDAENNEEMPYRLEAVHCFRNEHKWLNHRFEEVRADIGETFDVKTGNPATPLVTRLPPGCSYLFHATNPSSAMSIMKSGFQVRHAGSTTGTMYGNGIYMAECSSKSDEYGREDSGNCFPGLLAMLVCKCYVAMPLVVNEPGDHCTVARDQGFNCVCGDRETTKGTYREFVFFNEAQVYPEFAIIYRRQYIPEKVPANMRTKTSGTTGRFYQYRGDIFGFKGWRNVPVEVNKALINAEKHGNTIVDNLRMADKDLVWNLADKQVKDKTDPEKFSPIRPPMQPPS